MCSPFKNLLRAGLLLTVSFAATGNLVAQDKFTLTPTTPSSTESTWTDSQTTTAASHVELPAGVTIQNLPSDSAQTRGLTTKRKLQIVTVDAAQAPKLQVTYLQILFSNKTSTSPEASIDLSEPIKDKIFFIDCSSEAVTESAGSAVVSADEIGLVKRECQQLKSLNSFANFINGMSVGETRQFNEQHPLPLFSQDIEDVGLKSGEITLKTVTPDPSATATFSLSAQTANASTSGENTIIKYQGELVIDSKGLKIELTLKSEPVTTVRRLPDGQSEIKSQSQLTLIFRRQIS